MRPGKDCRAIRQRNHDEWKRLRLTVAKLASRIKPSCPHVAAQGDAALPSRMLVGRAWTSKQYGVPLHPVATCQVKARACWVVTRFHTGVCRLLR